MPVTRTLRSAVTAAACSRPVAWGVTAATRGRVPSQGITLDLSHADVPNRIRAAVLWRLYERAEIGLIQRHLPHDLDVVELGSSFGVTAAHALAVLDEGRHLVAVEANAALLPALRTVLADGRVEIMHGAIAYGSPGDFVEFHVHPTNHLHSRLNARPSSVPVQVPRLTLGQIVSAHDIGRYSLIADIEGAEAGMLVSDPSALERCDCMIIELHATTHDGVRVERADLTAQVEALGFRKVDEQRRTAVFVRP